MKKFGSALALAIGMAAGFPTVLLAGAVQDQVVSASQQTYILTPGSTAYSSWEAWIKQQQARKDIPQLSAKGVGVITIKVVSAAPTPRAISAASLHAVAAPADAGGPPPVGLPMTGTPGQKITITNQLPNGTYQVWEYQYQAGGAASGDGWVALGSGICSVPHCSVTITTRPD